MRLRAVGLAAALTFTVVGAVEAAPDDPEPVETAQVVSPGRPCLSKPVPVFCLPPVHTRPGHPTHPLATTAPATTQPATTRPATTRPATTTPPGTTPATTRPPGTQPPPTGTTSPSGTPQTTQLVPTGLLPASR